MPSFYIYFISSLPMLNLGTKPPFSFSQFLNLCERYIPTGDIEEIKKASISGEYIYTGIHPILKKWQEFDAALRDELVKIRSSHKHQDPTKYLRGDAYAGPHIISIAMNAHRNPSILEGERYLDQERWYFLEGITLGHYFDLDVLIVYAVKLLILERWEKINTADKSAVLEETLTNN